MVTIISRWSLRAQTVGTFVCVLGLLVHYCLCVLSIFYCSFKNLHVFILTCFRTGTPCEFFSVCFSLFFLVKVLQSWRTCIVGLGSTKSCLDNEIGLHARQSIHAITSRQIKDVHFIRLRLLLRILGCPAWDHGQTLTDARCEFIKVVIDCFFLETDWLRHRGVRIRIWSIRGNLQPTLFLNHWQYS